MSPYAEGRGQQFDCDRHLELRTQWLGSGGSTVLNIYENLPKSLKQSWKDSRNYSLSYQSVEEHEGSTNFFSRGFLFGSNLSGKHCPDDWVRVPTGNDDAYVLIVDPRVMHTRGVGQAKKSEVFIIGEAYSRELGIVSPAGAYFLNM